MKKIIVANWKMQGSREFIEDFIPQISSFLAQTAHQTIICPPFPYLSVLKESLGVLPHTLTTQIGAQNCHWAEKGAFTGEVSASMLVDLGCQIVILGHSERRILNGETNHLVRDKATAAHQASLKTILCIGETLDDKVSGRTIDIITEQLMESLPPTASSENTIIAYEPVWAIGTGYTPTLDDIADVHRSLRSTFDRPFPLLYGGSVNGENAKSIMGVPHVDGVLVGGASLKVSDFKGILA